LPSELPHELAKLILDHIESVPHIEALMLIWENAPRTWTEAEVSERIYRSLDSTRKILRDLQRQELLAGTSEGGYGLIEDPARRDVATRIVEVYRDNVYRVATLIHSRAPQGMREFAKAFDLRGKT
jgi:hypothetical protein